MYAIEFETDITNKYIELKNYEKLVNKHAKIIILIEDTPQPESQANKIEEFNNLIKNRINLPKLDSDIDIVKLCNESDSDIF